MKGNPVSAQAQPSSALREAIERTGGIHGVEAVAVACYDYRSGSEFSVAGTEWFHAASTIKVPVLVGVFRVLEEGHLSPTSRVHVRNRFFSAADGTAFRVEPSRDPANEVHAQIGKTMRLVDLAKQMIVASSNLATNLLVDLVGVEKLREALEELGVEGIEFRRGVEDERAFEADINNRVTAPGLVAVLRLIEEGRAASPAACQMMLDILHAQEFRSGIPAGVPEGTRVANKTGEISTVAHDTGLVYPPDREPYALAILTRWQSGVSTGRREALAELSRAVYDFVVGLR